MDSKEFCAIKEWWPQVTVTPEDSSTTVFSRGIPHGESGDTPRGGQTAPISMLGLSLLWKKAQKKEKKKRTSETIKKTTPKRIPLLRGVEWNPWKVASRITSRHQLIIVIPTNRRPTKIPNIEENLNQKANPAAKQKAPSLPVIGHGEGLTKKNGLVFIERREITSIFWLTIKYWLAFHSVREWDYLSCFRAKP